MTIEIVATYAGQTEDIAGFGTAGWFDFQTAAAAVAGFRVNWRGRLVGRHPVPAVHRFITAHSGHTAFVIPFEDREEMLPFLLEVAVFADAGGASQRARTIALTLATAVDAMFLPGEELHGS